MTNLTFTFRIEHVKPVDIISSHKGWNKNDHHFADNLFHFIFLMTWFTNDMHCLLHHLWKSLANHRNLEQKFIIDSEPYIIHFVQYHRADSRFSPCQWETSLQSNTIFHWLGATPLMWCCWAPTYNQPWYYETKTVAGFIVAVSITWMSPLW